MATQTSTQSAQNWAATNTATRKRIRRTPLDWVGEIAKYVILLVLAASFILPFYWMVSSALKDDNQVFTVPPVWIPNPAYWSNFLDAWFGTHLDFTLYTINTVFYYAIPATIGTVISSAMVAYSFSRLRWPGRDAMFAVVLATMMIPYWVTMVPLFIIFKNLGWINTFLPLVVPRFFGNAFFIFLLRQFFLAIPYELSDAARIDGANEFQTMTRIILPLAKPALVVVALFTFMDCWNDYLGPLIYVNIDTKWVLALGVDQLAAAMREAGNVQNAYPYLMAVSTIITLPIFLAFFFAQRTFIEGISLTGLKG
jgi:ABC-type glycerol-3-phosphate transport system permease component